MSSYLLDTNVLSEIIRKRPSERVLERMRRFPSKALATSAISITELRYGAARHPQGEALWERISREVLPLVHVVPLEAAAAEKAGDLLARLESRGAPIGLEDVLIGSTALANGLTIVTRNVDHFERIEGLVIENWWI